MNRNIKCFADKKRSGFQVKSKFFSSFFHELGGRLKNAFTIVFHINLNRISCKKSFTVSFSLCEQRAMIRLTYERQGWRSGNLLDQPDHPCPLSVVVDEPDCQQGCDDQRSRREVSEDFLEKSHNETAVHVVFHFFNHFINISATTSSSNFLPCFQEQDHNYLTFFYYHR